MTMSLFNIKKPIEMYEFTQGDVVHYFCSSKTVTYDNNIYTKAVLERGTIEITSDVTKSGIDLEFPIDNSFATQFVGFSPDIPTTVKIIRANRDDIDDNFILWQGRIMSASTQDAIITIYCESLYTEIQALGLRARYERGCRHILYSKGCSVNVEDHEVVAKVVATTATTVIIDTLLDEDVYIAGMFLAPNGAYRYVTKQEVNEGRTLLHYSRPLSTSLEIGEDISIYKGCNQSMTVCRDRFDNLLNYGGWPWLPSENPFEGNPFY